MLIAVIGCDAVLPEVRLQAFDFSPSQAQTWAHGQVQIGNAATVIEAQQAVLWVDLADRRQQPLNLARYHCGHWRHRFFQIKAAAADQGPGRPVIVLSAGFR